MIMWEIIWIKINEFLIKYWLNNLLSLSTWFLFSSIKFYIKISFKFKNKFDNWNIILCSCIFDHFDKNFLEIVCECELSMSSLVHRRASIIPILLTKLEEPSCLWLFNLANTVSNQCTHALSCLIDGCSCLSENYMC